MHATYLYINNNCMYSYLSIAIAICMHNKTLASSVTMVASYMDGAFEPLEPTSTISICPFLAVIKRQLAK